MFKRISLLLILFLFFFSCNVFNNEEIGVVQYPAEQAGSYIIPIVDPGNQRIPFPNNLLIDSETGKVNIPIFSDDSQSTVITKWQINSLDGFSTETTIYVDFTYPLDLSSVTYYSDDITHSTVLLLSFDNNTPKFIDIAFKFYPLNGKNRLVITPVNVLKEKTQFIVLIKKGIKGINGVAVSPSPFYLFLKSDYPLYNTETAESNTPALTDEDALQLEEIRASIVKAKLFDALAFLKIAQKDDLLLLWDFTTQSITKTMIDTIRNVNGYINQAGIDYPAVAQFDDDLSFEVPGICVYAPSAATEVCGEQEDDETLKAVYDNYIAMGYPLAVSWVISGYFYTENFRYLMGTFNKELSWIPEKIHFYLTIPSGTDKTGATVFSDPFPLIIYQHGITRNKKDMFVVANNFALAGFATIAIDLPDHGERREGDLDLNGDGTLDGDNFIDPVNLSTSRDRIRQTIVDLYILSQVVKNWNQISDTFSVGPYNFPIYDLFGSKSLSPYTPMNGNVDLDPERIYFLGHSLGAIIGSIFMAISPDINVGVINAGGAEIPDVISDSLVFGPVLKMMMASSLGMSVNTSQFDSFFYDFLQAARWIIGSGDPINYVRYWNNPLSVLVDATGSEIKNSKKTVLLQGSRYDYVVPDKYRDMLAYYGGLKNESVTSTPTVPVPVVSPGSYIQFNSYISYSNTLTLGTHSLILTPAKVNSDFSVAITDPVGSVYYLPYYLEMYNEINSFFFTNGTYLYVEDKSAYLPTQATCYSLETNNLCSFPQYQSACYLCTFWPKELIYKK